MKIKSIILGTLLVLGLNFNLLAVQNDPFQLSTHILDISKGVGASGVEVHLFKQTITNNKEEWVFISQDTTDENGRIKAFLARETNKSNVGIYKLVFMVAPYLQDANGYSFYPYIDVIFNISNENHYHVPITLSNFGYSTYRGN